MNDFLNSCATIPKISPGPLAKSLIMSNPEMIDIKDLISYFKGTRKDEDLHMTIKQILVQLTNEYVVEELEEQK